MDGNAVFRPQWEVMTRLTIALLLGAVSANIPARAQHMNEKDSPCASVVVTADLANCLAKARDKVDAELSAVYRAIRGKLDGADTQRLVAAQRLWIQFRDANCTAEHELYAGGTAAGPAYLACLEAMTRARTKDLRITYGVRMK
jgi:uncharacterized protein YecT (DUF1311 family)